MTTGYIEDMPLTTSDQIDKEGARKVLEHALKSLEEGTLEGLCVLMMTPPSEEEKQKYAKEIGDRKIVGTAYCASLEGHANNLIAMASTIYKTVLLPLQIRSALASGAVVAVVPVPQSAESPADSSGTDPERPRSH